MRRFRFSLDTLLSLRREQEQECEIALARASGQLAAVRNRIQAAREDGERAFLNPGASIEELRCREGLWQKSQNDRRALEQKIGSLEKEYQKARNAYNEAHAKRYSLDKLREKRHEQWKKQYRREEVKQLDEAAGRSLFRSGLGDT